MSRRTQMVERVIREEITGLIQRGKLKDPRIHELTTITAVECAGDLSAAKVYFSVMGEDDAIESTGQGLTKAAGFLQRHLAKALRTRNVPALTFLYDGSAAYADRIGQLLNSLPEASAPEEDADAEAPEEPEDA